jgi:hypothetical protein
MTLNANYAGSIELADAEAGNTEKRDTLIFAAFAVALVATIALTGFTVGLAGVGMIAILETAAMLVVCILLTAG